MNVNNFHQVNDRYGHHIGDKILQRLALRLKKRFPSVPNFIILVVMNLPSF
ncbi:diguanylate cyclase [Idiomarina sp. PL1-037]|uniref:diguanylate cyclase domain-containing protein n=1 Tax=Idiomarina sp. PL1-037 TaxID=3095365 RepID=UPI002ACC0FD2|nr:diguanylate cyclase [Idiomarina sp. PL1-037]WQC54261.1 diguanylate cyclase [Idiomarina sp. PL1-037]